MCITTGNRRAARHSGMVTTYSRQHRHLYRTVKRRAREIERIAARKGPGYQGRLRGLYRKLLDLAAMILDRAEQLRASMSVQDGVDLEIMACNAQLKQFMGLTHQVCGTDTRRVLEGQTVPNRDKLFSVFETHIHLYERGKAAEPVHFGRQVLVYEDGVGFITHAYLMAREKDGRQGHDSVAFRVEFYCFHCTASCTFRGHDWLNCRRGLCPYWRMEEQGQHDGGQGSDNERDEKQAAVVGCLALCENLLQQVGAERVGRQRARSQDHRVEEALGAGPHVFREILIHEDIDCGEEEPVADAVQRLDGGNGRRIREKGVHQEAR